MLNLPVPPRTRISRQLKCVSCQEPFTVSEDDPDRPYNIGNNWQSPVTNSSDIQLHYQDDRTRRSVSPGPHARGQRSAHHTWDRRRRESVCCPRCGADNRNWLNLLHLSNTTRPLHVWQQRFPTAFTGIIISTIFATLAAAFAYQTKTPLTRAIPLILFTFIAAILPAYELTKTEHWHGLREDWHLRRINHVDRVNKETKLWFRGIMLILISSFIVPVVLFLYGPRIMNSMIGILNPEPEEIVKTAAAPYIIQLNEQLTAMPEDVAALTRDTINKIEDIHYADTPVVQSVLNDFNRNLEELLQDLSDSTQPDTIRQITTLQATVDEAIAEVNRKQNEEIKKALTESGSTIKFLALWGMLVGLSSLLSMFTSMDSLKQFVKQIDNQLPPPIYYSVANMTRVVVWEAKRALEIGNEVQHMQWTAVQRNNLGGISLQGIHRDNNYPAPGADPLTTRVLAEHYEIITDRWGHIIEANIKPVRALQRPHHSRLREMTLSDELFGRISNQPLEIRRP